MCTRQQSNPTADAFAVELPDADLNCLLRVGLMMGSVQVGIGAKPTLPDCNELYMRTVSIPIHSFAGSWDA